MADNIPITPGSGAVVATREGSYSGETANLQVVGLATVAGADDAKTITDISEANPLPVGVYGEMIEAMEALRFAISSLNRSIGAALPGVAGFPIMEVRQATAANLNVALASTTIASGTVTTVSTLTNQAQIGGFAANDQIPAFMHLQADNLRRNIAVT